MIKALIFDFDGLIVDTEAPEFQSWQELCQEYGVELTMEIWAPCIGSNRAESNFDPYSYFSERVQQTFEREEILARRRRRHQELMLEQTILPGVERLIQVAQERGMQLAVASSSPRSWVESQLRRVGLLDAFDLLVCGDEVEHVKPFPDIYTQALEKLAVQAEQAIAFEDSLNGMLAARSAGIFCVVVPNPLTELLSFGEVDLRLRSLLDLDLAMFAEHS